MNALLADALGYAERGLSVIPTKGKRPTISAWKPYAVTPATSRQLRKWYASNRPDGVAVICGDVSGGLVCRDFDVMASYELWAGSHPDLAAILPNSETTRGKHVYFCNDYRHIVKLGDGELRGNGICLLPHSNPSGTIYRWVNPLPDGPLPSIDPWEVGLAFDGTEPTETTEPTEPTEAISESGCDSPVTLAQLPTEVTAAIECAIDRTMPQRSGERNDQVFIFARSLKAVPMLADADAESLRGILKEWHRRARPVIGTKPLEETWIDFRRAWKRVILPLGDDAMGLILERAVTTDLPTVALEYEQPELRVLVALCRELQRAAGERPFWLACRTVERLLGVGRVTAGRWLGLLVDDKILFLVEKGSQRTGRASRYCYIADGT